jgi:antitoxin VapB
LYFVDRRLFLQTKQPSIKEIQRFPVDSQWMHNIYIIILYIQKPEGRKMALSIRNTKTEKLARELAAESGETITQAITHALEERMERLRGRSSTTDVVEEILKISKRCRTIPDQDQRSADEILNYGPTGAPL